MDQNLNMKGELMELVEENRRSLWAWSGPKKKKKKSNRTRKASIIKEKFDTLDYIKTKDTLVLKLGCQRIHNMSSRHGAENQAGVLPCGLQKLPWLRPVTLLLAPSIEKWLRVEISGLLQGWGTRISQESRMWFCYVRGSFVPQPPPSLRTLVHSSQNTPLRSPELWGCPAKSVWEGGQPHGALRLEPDPLCGVQVLWVPGPERKPKMRWGPALPFAGAQCWWGQMRRRRKQSQQSTPLCSLCPRLLQKCLRPLAERHASFQI